MLAGTLNVLISHLGRTHAKSPTFTHKVMELIIIHQNLNLLTPISAMLERYLRCEHDEW